MKLRHFLVALSLGAGAIAATATAQSGVDNPAVQARMDGMKRMAAHMKTLGDMAKGQRAFDPATARAALDRVGAEARQIPALFGPRQLHPASEAKAAIWTEWESFTLLADQLAASSRNAAAGLRGQGDLGPALQLIGASCGSCHRAYRQ